MKRGRWSDEEKDRIRREYPTTNTQVLADSMGRPRDEVNRHAARLGVRKSAQLVSEARAKAASVRVQRRREPITVAGRFGEHSMPPWVINARRHSILDDDDDTGGGAAVCS